MNNIIESTRKKYNMFSENDRIVVAVSGGADSMALLHYLAGLRNSMHLEIYAAHFNHELRGTESDSDQQLVSDFCNDLKIKLFVKRDNILKISSQTGEGIEECGRRMRYLFFDGIVKDLDAKLATAHNINDSIETFIFNFSRGSGLNGLMGIPPVRGNIIRPLIECPRGKIEEYCALNKITYTVDSSNYDKKFMRNLIRHDVIPVLEKVNGNYTESALRSFNLLRSDNHFITSVAESIKKEAAISDSKYKLELLSKQHSAVLSRIIKSIIFDKTGYNIDYSTCCRCMEIVYNKHGKQQINGEICLRIRNGLLELAPMEYDSSGFCVAVDPGLFGENDREIVVPVDESGYAVFKLFEKRDLNFEFENINKNYTNYYMDYDKISGNLFLRSRKPKDVVKLSHRGMTKSINKLFNQDGVEPELRDRIPILADDNGVLAVWGFGIDKRVEITPDTSRILEFRFAEQ